MRCCVELKELRRQIHLRDTGNFTHRNIKIYYCPVCEALRAELQQYNIKEGSFSYIRPKKKQTAEFIRQYEAEPYIENVILSLKQGNKSNMGFLYGVGSLIKDFNSTTRGNRLSAVGYVD